MAAAILFVLVLSVYWQVGNHAFINIDDPAYVSENLFVQRGLTRESISWAFTSFETGNWHPLTWLSHMLDVEMLGVDAGRHHRMNLLYHLLNTELLFFVLWRMTGGLWQSALLAALFGVHPLHVESVAWVAERKDVLSTSFWILTMGAYLRYVRRPSVRRYLLVAATFALGLMCKPMLVTLPFVLLLLDFWPLDRMVPAVSPASRLVWEKVPLLALAVLSCIMTYLAQSAAGAVTALEHIPLGARIANASISGAAYLARAVWPSSLAVFYPHPWIARIEIPAWQLLGSALLLGGGTFMALRQAHCRPCLAVGWLWYLGTLVPVIGLVQVGGQAMADRYTYVPLIGAFIAVAWGCPAPLLARRFRGVAFGFLGSAVIVALAIASWIQVGYWRNSVTLLSRTLAVTDRNWFALNNLGVAYEEIGQIEQAVVHYREAVRIRPDYAGAWNNLGVACSKLRQYEQAIVYFREALRIRSGDLRIQDSLSAEVWNNLAVALQELGRVQEAIDCCRMSVKVKPDYADAWNNLGILYGSLGKFRQAIDCFTQALRIKPGHVEAWNNLGVAFSKLGQFRQAIAYFREALRIKPDHAEARKHLDAANKALGWSR